MVRMKALNMCKRNTYQLLYFMFKIKTNAASRIFENQFTEIHSQNSNTHSKNSFLENQLVYSQTRFSG